MQPYPSVNPFILLFSSSLKKLFMLNFSHKLYPPTSLAFFLLMTKVQRFLLDFAALDFEFLNPFNQVVFVKF